MRKMFDILGFEFQSITTKKSWIITTAIFMVLVLAVSFIPQIMALFGQEMPGESSPETRYTEMKVGVYLTDPALSRERVQQASPIALTFYDDQKSMEQALMDADISEAITIRSTDDYLLTLKDKQVFSQQPFAEVLLSNLREMSLLEGKLDYPAFKQAMSKPFQSAVHILGADAQTNYGYTYVLIFIFYFLVIFYGTTVSTSVAREKNDRTMELLITSTTSDKLLFGKVFGSGLAGLLQFGLIIGALVLGLRLNQNAWGIDIARYFEIPWQTMLLFVSFTLVGYLFYLFIYAMLGATVSKIEDVSQASMPVTLIMIISFIVVNSTMSSPESLIMKVASYLPFSSPFAMFARSTLGSTVTLVEVLISFAILVLSTVFIGFVASKLYRLGTLQYGNRLTLGKAFRLLMHDND